MQHFSTPFSGKNGLIELIFIEKITLSLAGDGDLLSFDWLVTKNLLSASFHVKLGTIYKTVYVS